MNQVENRSLIRDSARRPIRICMDDGKTFTIAHPDFALAALDAIVLASGPGHDYGAPWVICGLEHISRIEVLSDSDPVSS